MSLNHFATAVLISVALPLTALADQHPIGAVYTSSNDAVSNSVLVFDRFDDGSLAHAGEFGTGGLGTGGGLGNPGAIAVDDARRWLFVVNAGSDDVSVFAIQEDGLALVEQEYAGGQNPVSLTVSGGILYVLSAGGNVGGVDSVSGFRVETDGQFTAIPGAVQPLSAASTAPAQISFNTDGDVLVVTEKATNLISTYTVDVDGIASPPVSHVSGKGVGDNCDAF